MNDETNVDFTILPGHCSDLRQQKKKPNRTSVFVEDQFVCGAETKAVEQCEIIKGSWIDETLIRQLLVLDERFQFQEQCYRLLARRAYCRGELETKGRQKGYTEAIIREILDGFEEKGWVNDRDYAREYAEVHFNRKQWGPEKIRAGLLQKGISKDVISYALEQVEDSDAQLNSMINVVGKHQNRLLRNSDPKKQKHKLVDLLRRKGYHPEVIYRNLDHLIQHLTDETTDT